MGGGRSWFQVYRYAKVPLWEPLEPVTVVVWLVPAPTGSEAWYVMDAANVYVAFAVGVNSMSNFDCTPGPTVTVLVSSWTTVPLESKMSMVTVMFTLIVLGLVKWILKSSCAGKNGCDLNVMMSTVGPA